MNPETPTSTVAPQPQETKRRWWLWLLAAIVVLLVVGGVYYWQHQKLTDQASLTTTANTQIANLNKKLLAAQSTVATATAKVTPVTYTETLPGGGTMSYPLTATNSQVLWWYQGHTGLTAAQATQANALLGVSSTKVMQFLSQIPDSVLDGPSLCGNDALDSTNLQVESYDTTTKKLSNNQYADCIEQIANTPSSPYAAQAAQVYSQARSDIQNWANSLSYK